MMKLSTTRVQGSRGPRLSSRRQSSSTRTQALPPTTTTREQLAQRAVSFLAAASIALQSSLLFALSPAAAQPVLTPDEKNSIEVFKKASPTVVFIQNLALKQDIFTPNFEEIPQGAGSGVILDGKGRILTNYHVVRDSADLSVTVGTGLESVEYTKVRVLGFDSDKDIAIVEIIPDDKKPLRSDLFKPARLGSSDDLQVGQKVYAIGHPFGLQHTITSGIVSGIEREIPSGINGKPITGVVQTDCAINPGNSGGALLDTSGELIGLNTAIYSQSGGSNGVGFAIGISAIKPSIDQIIEYGRVIRPFLGIQLAPDFSISQLGLNGVLILDTKEGGPAFEAGIKGTSRDDFGRLVLGDIIVGINGKPVKNSGDLFRVLSKQAVGDTVKLELLREKAKETVEVKLAALDGGAPGPLPMSAMNFGGPGPRSLEPPGPPQLQPRSREEFRERFVPRDRLGSGSQFQAPSTAPEQDSDDDEDFYPSAPIVRQTQQSQQRQQQQGLGSSQVPNYLYRGKSTLGPRSLVA